MRVPVDGEGGSKHQLGGNSHWSGGYPVVVVLAGCAGFEF